MLLYWPCKLSYLCLVVLITPLSDGFLCSSGRLQSSGPRWASAESRGHCGDPGFASPRPWHVHRNTHFHRAQWFRTQGPCQTSGHRTPVRKLTFPVVLCMAWFELTGLMMLCVTSCLLFIVLCWCFMKSYLVYLQSGWGEGAMETAAEVIMLLLFPSHRDRQLVFLTEEERASLAQVNLCSSEPSDSGLLERLFSSDISSVYRLGKESTWLIKSSGRGKGGVVPQSHGWNIGHVWFDVQLLVSFLNSGIVSDSFREEQCFHLYPQLEKWLFNWFTLCVSRQTGWDWLHVHQKSSKTW